MACCPPHGPRNSRWGQRPQLQYFSLDWTILIALAIAPPLAVGIVLFPRMLDYSCGSRVLCAARPLLSVLDTCCCSLRLISLLGEQARVLGRCFDCLASVVAGVDWLKCLHRSIASVASPIVPNTCLAATGRCSWPSSWAGSATRPSWRTSVAPSSPRRGRRLRTRPGSSTTGLRRPTST